MKSLDQARLEKIKLKLIEIEEQFVFSQEIQNDPVSHVFELTEPQDREVSAFVAAVFSYGNVKQLKKTLSIVFALLGPSPAQKLKTTDGHYWKNKIPEWFKHRFNSAQDLGCLLTWLGEALRRYDTLENLFMAKKFETLEEGLENFITTLTSLPSMPYKPQKGVYFFFPRPSKKSACKRLMLFLRWVVGTGPMDLGLWTKVRKDLLLIPLDTHVLRISRHLGFTKRKDNSWKTAHEITQVLKKLDQKDPTRFDFSLCHLGISKECPSRFKIEICGQCRMRELCVTYSRRRKSAI